MGNIKRKSISRQIIMLLLIEVLISLFIVFFSYYCNVDMVTNEYLNYSSQISDQTKVFIGTQCETIQRTIQIISSSYYIQEFMNETDRVKLMLMLDDVRFSLRSALYNIGEVVDCTLLSINGNRVYFNYPEPINIEELMINFEQNKNNIYSRCYNRSETAYGVDTFKIAAPIYSNSKDNKYGQFIGTLIIVVNSKMFFPLDDNNHYGGRMIFLTDNLEKIFFSNVDGDNEANYQAMIPLTAGGQSGIFELKDSKYTYLKSDLSYLNGELYCITPNTVLYKDIKDIRFISLCFVSFIMLILTLMCIMVYRNITIPIKTVIDFINNYNKNGLTHQKQRIYIGEYYNEINIMAERFNNMLDENDKLTQDLLQSNMRLYEIELASKEAEIAMLRSQINPHFLYNTLECVKSIAAARDITEIVQIVTSLGRTLRYSIEKDEITNIKSEINMIKDYLQIYCIRYPNRLTVQYNIDSSIENVLIPRMTLQPIVENALYHGIEKSHELGKLTILAYKDGASNFISISDSGAGMTEERLKTIRKSLNSDISNTISKRVDGNIGLINVQRRLILTYGDASRLKIESCEGAGTSVLIHIPDVGDEYV